MRFGLSDSHDALLLCGRHELLAVEGAAGVLVLVAANGCSSCLAFSFIMQPKVGTVPMGGRVRGQHPVEVLLWVAAAQQQHHRNTTWLELDLVL